MMWLADHKPSQLNTWLGFYVCRTTVATCTCTLKNWIPHTGLVAHILLQKNTMQHLIHMYSLGLSWPRMCAHIYSGFSLLLLYFQRKTKLIHEGKDGYRTKNCWSCEVILCCKQDNYNVKDSIEWTQELHYYVQYLNLHIFIRYKQNWYWQCQRLLCRNIAMNEI